MRKNEGCQIVSLGFTQMSTNVTLTALTFQAILTSVVLLLQICMFQDIGLTYKTSEMNMIYYLVVFVLANELS